MCCVFFLFVCLLDVLFMVLKGEDLETNPLKKVDSIQAFKLSTPSLSQTELEVPDVHFAFRGGFQRSRGQQPPSCRAGAEWLKLFGLTVPLLS